MQIINKKSYFRPKNGMCATYFCTGVSGYLLRVVLASSRLADQRSIYFNLTYCLSSYFPSLHSKIVSHAAMPPVRSLTSFGSASTARARASIPDQSGQFNPSLPAAIPKLEDDDSNPHVVAEASSSQSMSERPLANQAQSIPSATELRRVAGPGNREVCFWTNPKCGDRFAYIGTKTRKLSIGNEFQFSGASLIID